MNKPLNKLTSPVVLVVGAGPAGLTAAMELLAKGIRPLVIEQSNEIGGISRTVNHLGNRMDIGGHRFFSKSTWVTQWWKAAMALPVKGKDASTDWLTRGRLSRIYYLRQFFDYPLKLNAATLKKLGLFRVAGIGWDYMLAKAFPVKNESSLQDFLINRFGNALYRTFFKDYTEKVWGVPCPQISAAWGAQRIKGLSIRTAVAHAVKKAIGLDKGPVATSLIEKFQYPRLGPGQLWERVAAYLEENGVEIRRNNKLTTVFTKGGKVWAVQLEEADTTEFVQVSGVFSSMPVKDLVAAIQPEVEDDDVPAGVREIAENLPYRDFVTVGVLVTKKLDLPDNWIYVQEPDVKLGRIQIFNNWSPDLVKNQETTWLGLEYFCQEDDAFWAQSDESLKSQAADELAKLGLVSSADIDLGASCVIRVPKAYPAYFGTYDQFDTVKAYLDSFENLYLMGRNGQHRYNNQDHSMLTAKRAVEAFLGEIPKAAVWEVNVDDDYHESASPDEQNT